MLKKVRDYNEYNFRRYSKPWAAKVSKDRKYDFSVGVYSGFGGAGGELCIINPVEGQVYAYGQKDNRGGNTARQYIVYKDGEFIEIDNKELSHYLNSME